MIPIWEARGRVCRITILPRRFVGSSLGVTWTRRSRSQLLGEGSLQLKDFGWAPAVCNDRAMQTFRTRVNNPAESPSEGSHCSWDKDQPLPWLPRPCLTGPFAPTLSVLCLFWFLQHAIHIPVPLA